MAKKKASYSDYEVSVVENGKIIVKRADEVLPNSMGALRDIASAIGFVIEPKWNTQQNGSKLIDFLNSGGKAFEPSTEA